MIRSTVNRLSVKGKTGKLVLDSTGRYVLWSDYVKTIQPLIAMLESLCTTPELRMLLHQELKKIDIEIIE